MSTSLTATEKKRHLGKHEQKGKPCDTSSLNRKALIKGFSFTTHWLLGTESQMPKPLGTKVLGPFLIKKVSKKGDDLKV